MSLFSRNLADPIDSGRYFGGRAYPDPFVTYATLSMPRTIEDVLRWCETLWSRNGTYAQACRRVVRYFLTKIDIQDASDDEKQKYLEFLNDMMNVITTLAYIGDDFMCYGNSFTSIWVPFRRHLRCKHCSVEQPLHAITYQWKNFSFQWECSACRKTSTADKPIDRRTLEEKDVRIIRWSPHQIKIRQHPISQKCVYLWDPPADVIRQVQEGDPFILETMNWEFVEAIKSRKMFKFTPNYIYHMKEESLSGIRSGGWGVSRFLTNFSQAFHVQMLKMYNEVLAQEYIVPFRVLSPAPGQGATDPMVNSNLGSFTSRVSRMLADHRRRPGGWHFVPFPINYQVLGGEGTQMATHELINAATDEMLNAAGVPAELYKGTLQFQAMPTALRLFQQTWPHFVSACNGWLNWLMETLSIVFRWDGAKAQLQPVTLADDIENKQILLQLAAANQLPKSIAYAPLGIDATEAQKRLFDEARSQRDEQAKFDREVQQQQMLEQQLQSSTMQAAGTVPGSAGTDAQSSVGDVVARAEQMANKLLKMPYENRKSEMLKIKKQDATLHALIKVKLEEQRGQAQQVGGQQVIQQQSQEQAGGVAA